MWKPICVDEKEFVFKSTTLNHESNTIHQISLTNFINIWQEQLTKTDLIQRCKKINPLFEAKPNVLVNHILSLLETENHNTIRHLEESENIIVLRLHSKLEQFKFNFEFILQLQPPEKVYKELTLPMLQMISELQRRKKLLSSLLTKKDIEIAQYRLEGAELNRKSVQTEPFDEGTFNEKCLETFMERKSDVEEHPSHVFTLSTLTLYQQVTAPKITSVKAEGDAIIEPEMENTVDILLREKKSSPKRKHKPKTLSVEPSKVVQVNTAMDVTKEVVRVVKKKSRPVLKNL